MQKETDKHCIGCSVLLDGDNWAPENRGNYVNKCRACIRVEKRAYQTDWRKKNPGAASVVSKRYKENLRKNDPVKARARDAYSDCKKRSQSCGMEFDLTPDFVVGLMRKTTICPYFGWPLTFSVGKERTLASLDRIDSSRGYSKDNVQIISYLANLMKSYATADELLAFAEGVMREHGTASFGMLGLGAMRSLEKVKGAEGNR